MNSDRYGTPLPTDNLVWLRQCSLFERIDVRGDTLDAVANELEQLRDLVDEAIRDSIPKPGGTVVWKFREWLKRALVIRGERNQENA